MNPYVVSYPHDRITCSAATMLNESLSLYQCRHVAGFAHLPDDADGAIVIFHGQREAAKPHIAERLSDYVYSLRWVLFISLGDEGGDFPYSGLDHANMRLWIQTPKPGRAKADRYLIEGYHPSTHSLMWRVADHDRDMDWFFAGQANHARRNSCVAVLSALDRGTLLATSGFQQGMPLADYYRHLSCAKVAPCPSGPLTPDSFRFAEALEAGAVPVLDAFAPDGVTGYWDLVIPGHPFRVVSDWATFPSVLSDLLAHFTAEQRIAQYWWRSYKLKMRQQWLPQDLLALGACRSATAGGAL